MIRAFFKLNSRVLDILHITLRAPQMIESVLCAISAIISCASVIDDGNYTTAGEVAIFSIIALMTNERNKHVGTTSKVAWVVVAWLIIGSIYAMPSRSITVSSLNTRELLIGLSVNLGMILLIKRFIYAMLAFFLRTLIKMLAENL
jgi:hypothetical protein